MSDSPGRNGYIVVVKGVEVCCETLEALNALVKQLSNGESAPSTQPVQSAPLEAAPTEPVKPKRKQRVVHKTCRRQCGRKGPILPSGGSSTICERCATVFQLQEWKQLERKHGRPLIYWKPEEAKQKAPVDEVKVERVRRVKAAPPPLPSPEPPTPKTTPDEKAEEPEPPPWKFEPSDEPLPDTSGMETADMQAALALAAQRGCSAAIEPLFESVKGLLFAQAKKAAWRARGSSCTQADIDDAAGEMRLHIFRRLNAFDPTKGKFVTWASWQMKAGKDHFVHLSRVVRVSANVYDASTKLWQAGVTFGEVHGREPTPEELEKLTGIAVEEQKTIRTLTQPGSNSSLDAPLDEENAGSVSRLAQAPSDDPSPLDILLHREQGQTSEAVNEALRELNPREREIIKRRYLGGEKDETLASIARDFDCTRENIRLIEQRALTKLRLILRGHFREQESA